MGTVPVKASLFVLRSQNSAKLCGSLLFREKLTGSLSRSPWECPHVNGGATRVGTLGKTSRWVVRSLWLPCTCVCLPQAELWGSALLTISLVEGWAESRRFYFLG